MQNDALKVAFEQGFGSGVAAVESETGASISGAVEDQIMSAAWDAYAADLTTTAAPAEREVVARIIDPDAFYRKDQTLAGRNPGWAVENVQACCDRAMTKASAILAKLQPSDRADQASKACSCEVAFGQNPECPAHGIGTLWRQDNPEADWRDAPAGGGADQREVVSEGGIPAGMVRWHGDESAPADWDSEKRVLFRDMGTGLYPLDRSANWSHEVISPDDIIAYTPLAAAASAGDKS